MRDRFQLLILRFFVILFALLAGYTLINFTLFQAGGLLPLKNTVANIWIPVGLSPLAAWIVLKPRLRILNLKASKGDWADFYSVIAMLAFGVSLTTAQEYMYTATGKHTSLQSIASISSVPSSRYYSVQQLYIDKQHGSSHSILAVSGKANQNLNMSIYVAIPLLAAVSDTTQQEPSAWMGVRYDKTINNKLSDKEKEDEYNSFVELSQRILDKSDLSQFTCLERIGPSEALDGYTKAIAANERYRANPVVLTAMYEQPADRNRKNLRNFLWAVILLPGIWVLMALVPSLNEVQVERIRAGRPDRTLRQEWRDFLEIFTPHEGYYVTPILLILNLGVFLMQAFSGLGLLRFSGSDLLRWGANYRPLVAEGQWWRLLTNIFLHGGLMHVVANMAGLLFAGFFLELLLGWKRYLLIYLVTGILASVASIAWYPATVSVGASGAIFGLYGAFLALLLTRVFPPSATKTFLVATFIFVVYNLLMGLAGGIDNAAHIGGLLSGFLIGLALRPFLRQKAGEEQESDGG